MEIFAGWDFSSKWPFGAYHVPREGPCMVVQIQPSGGTCWLAQKDTGFGSPGSLYRSSVRISPSYHLFYSADNTPVVSLRRNVEYNPSCALCLQRPPQSALSHDFPYCCQTCFRMNYLPVNLGWKFLAATAGPAFQRDACVLLPR